MRAVILWAISATSSFAMTGAECRDLQRRAEEVLPAVSELRVSPGVTEDGWCRIIDGPLGSGLEWRGMWNGQRISLDIRHESFVFEDLGPFEVEGGIETPRNGELVVGPIRLVKDDANRAVLFARAEWEDAAGSDVVASLTAASLSVTGNAKLLDDILAWAFRLDLASARSNFMQARDQRDEMLEWLDSVAAPMIDQPSLEAFRAFVAAYPRARGTARIAIRDDEPVAVGPLIAAVLFGSDFSEGQAARLVRDAGLSFSWRPE